MTQSSPTAATSTPQASGEGYLFGVPLGNLGWFGSLLIAVASGFMTFFAATFCAILFILIDNSVLHGNLNYTYSYLRVGLPLGLLVLVCALGYLGTLWFKRVLRRS